MYLCNGVAILSHVAYYGCHSHIHRPLPPMSGENRRLVADEPVEFEKQPVDRSSSRL